MATSRDVALIAGVSQTTVSRVLHDHPGVRPETRERVLRALRETNYAPDGLARAMITRKTGTIGVVIEDITNPFYPEVVEAFCRELAGAGHRMTLWNSGEAGEPAAVEAIQQRLVDGVIFTTATADSVVLKAAVRQGAPVVLFNRHVWDIDCDKVTADNLAGGRLVAEYFVDHGHERIGLITGDQRASTAIERERGFREGLRERGLDPDTILQRPGDFLYRRSREAMHELLGCNSPPTAVFCANDLTALGALDAARELSVKVPEEVWVVGFDDIGMASWRSFDLTTVRQPISEMVQAAVKMMLRRISDPGPQFEHRRFGSELIVRASTAHKQLRRENPG
jgi:LacI family transcriptional regulator